MPSFDRHDRRLALVAALIGVGVVLVSLLSHGGDIAGLIKFGGGGHVVERTAHVEALLGREVATVDELGHDGSMYFLQAIDPFFLDPDEHAVHLDRPVYRAQRMLFPPSPVSAASSPPEALLWTMALTNIAAIALGTVGAGRVAPATRRFVLVRPGLRPQSRDPVRVRHHRCRHPRLRRGDLGTLALEAGRDRSAAGWFAAAVLAREVMFLYLAGVLLLRLWKTRRIPWLAGAVPTMAAGAWAVYIRTRLDSHPGWRRSRSSACRSRA